MPRRIRCCTLHCNLLTAPLIEGNIMNKVLIPLLLFSLSAHATMTARVSGWLPGVVKTRSATTGAQVAINENLTALVTIGNDSGSSVNITSIKPWVAQTGDTGGGSLKAKAVNFGSVCLTGFGGPTGNCNNVAPGTSQSNGSSLVLQVPMVFFGSSSFPPFVSYVPLAAQFGSGGGIGSSLTYGATGGSVAAITGTYIFDAVLQSADGSYFTLGNTGSSTVTITAIPYKTGT